MLPFQIKKNNVIRFNYSYSNDSLTRTVFVTDVFNDIIKGWDFSRHSYRNFKLNGIVNIDLIQLHGTYIQDFTDVQITPRKEVYGYKDTRDIKYVRMVANDRIINFTGTKQDILDKLERTL